MGIGSKLTKLLEANNTNANELATKIDVSPQTIYSIIKRDSKKADIEVLLKIADTFGVTAEYFVYDEKPIKTVSTNKLLPSPSEEAYLKKMRFISDYSSAGAKMVSSVIDREYEIAQLLQTQANRIKELENNPIVVEKEKDTIVRLYTYMHKIASAGNGFYFDDIPTDTMEAPYLPGADFIIGVNGDSMEPTYSDGDLVYVEKRQIIEVGEIGVFILNNECFIKEAGENGLISHNEKYDTIPGTEKIQCIGKVLGKVEMN